MKLTLSKIVCLTLLVVGAAHANVTISVTDVPTTPNGVFSATIAGANSSDPTPNPCYGRRGGCDLRLFTIDESWLPGGRGKYLTNDYGDSWGYTNGVKDARGFRTLGDWWKNVGRKNRVGEDYLPDAYGTSPCVVLAAAQHTSEMIESSIVSNCARGLVQAATCAIEPGQIDVSLSVAQGLDAPATSVPGVSVYCDQTADVRIETMSGERIPLNGVNTSVAVLDWGSGFGKSLSLHLAGGRRQNISLRVKTEGVGGLDAGAVSGSSVVNLIYD